MELIDTVEKRPILITGCARSRTSLVAGIINICGAFGGKMSGPNSNNKKGMFENAELRHIVKDYLKNIGFDRMGQYPLPDIEKLTMPLGWRNKVLGVMHSQGYSENYVGPWMYKGAKMCLIWPIWHFAFPEARWVIVRRDTKGIVKSCQRTSFMRVFKHAANYKAVGADSEREGWEWWVKEHEKRFAEMHEAELDCREVWTDKIIDGDLLQVKDLIEWLGLKWREAQVKQHIDPSITRR